jgi:Ca2+-binding EF-hand superfamily protein
LGLVPSEQEVSEVIAETEFEDSNGTVHLSKFLPYVHQLFIERKMEPVPIEKLLEAFQVLDPDGKGFVTKDFMSRIMSEEGEPFSQEELEEMFSCAVDGSSNLIPYEYYLNQLMVDQ